MRQTVGQFLRARFELGTKTLKDSVDSFKVPKVEEDKAFECYVKAYEEWKSDKHIISSLVPLRKAMTGMEILCLPDEALIRYIEVLIGFTQAEGNVSKLSEGGLKKYVKLIKDYRTQICLE